jgi:hypothetical protein
MLSCLLCTIATAVKAVCNYQPDGVIGYRLSASLYKYLRLQCICVKREMKLYLFEYCTEHLLITFSITPSVSVITFSITPSVSVITFSITPSMSVITFSITPSMSVITFSITPSVRVLLPSALHLV